MPTRPTFLPRERWAAEIRPSPTQTLVDGPAQAKASIARDSVPAQEGAHAVGKGMRARKNPSKP